MASATTNQYRPELDGIRAICIILTINNHTQYALPFLVGSVGVDVFFALSGWLICTLLAQEAERSGAIDLRAFYIRRLFRIVPLYYVTVLLYGMAAVAMAVTGSGSDLTDFQKVWGWLVTFCSEYRPDDGPNLFGHAWTLGIEEKFYILVPLLLLAGIHSRRLAGAGLMISVVALLSLGGNAEQLARGYFGLTFGSLLALAAARREHIRQLLTTPSAAKLAIVLVAGSYLAALNGTGVAANLTIAAGAGLGIAFLWLRPGNVGSKMLGWRPLAWLGTLTYGIYLIHVLVINVVERVVAAAAPGLPSGLIFAASYASSVAVAWGLHITIEKPLQQLGRKLARSGRQVVAA